MINLHPDWLLILKSAWSVRLMALSAVLSGFGTGLAIAQPYLGVNPLWISAIVGLCATFSSLIGIYARIVRQPGMKNAT